MLAAPDEVSSAQVQTAGFLLLLATGKTRYLYTASETAFRYGGPLDSWRFSALDLVPSPDDPNLNGNLLQVKQPAVAREQIARVLAVKIAFK